MAAVLQITNTTDLAIDLPGLRVGAHDVQVAYYEHYNTDDGFAYRVNKAVDAGHFTIRSSDTDFDPVWVDGFDRRTTAEETDEDQIGTDGGGGGGGDDTDIPLTRVTFALKPGEYGGVPNTFHWASFAGSLYSEEQIAGTITSVPLPRDGTGSVAGICAVTDIRLWDVPEDLAADPGVAAQFTYVVSALDGTDLLVASLGVGSIEAGNSTVGWDDADVTLPIDSGDNVQFGTGSNASGANTQKLGVYVVSVTAIIGLPG